MYDSEVNIRSNNNINEFNERKEKSVIFNILFYYYVFHKFSL